ncbi:S-layer homology domain-containing protein [Rossellomorea oryzaecorticis]|uniref:S-layer homology domain-containing protein n=1 Tax=Rossellomorea oryzaecorticis TaxID=1396505 RepID=A0ABW8VLQ1_9BACI
MKKITSVFFTLLLFVSLWGQSQVEAESTFKDVHEGTNFYKEMMYLYENSIIQGYDDQTFKPGQKVTRAAAATMIGRSLDLNGEKRSTTFKDVSPQSYASGYIASAVEEGIIKGYTDQTFRPNEPVTRGEMSIFLARAFELQAQLEFDYFDIHPEQASYESIKKVSQAGIAQGLKNGLFYPRRDITRAEFSAFLARALNEDFRVEVPAISDPLVIKYKATEAKRHGGTMAFIESVNYHNGDLLFIDPYTPIQLMDTGKGQYSRVEVEGKALNEPALNKVIPTNRSGVGQITINNGAYSLSYTVVIGDQKDYAKQPINNQFLEIASYGHLAGCEFGKENVLLEEVEEYYGKADESWEDSYRRYGACGYSFGVPYGELDLKVSSIEKNMTGSGYTPSQIEQMIGENSEPTYIEHLDMYIQGYEADKHIIQFLYDGDTKKLVKYRMIY